MKNKKIIGMTSAALLLILLYAFDLHQYLSLSYLQSQQQSLNNYYAENPLSALFIFSGIYIAAAAISFPAASLLSLLAGALFGLVVGTIVASIASTIGATFAFLFARFFFRDSLQKHFAKKMAVIDKKIAEEGAFYLFTLRLLPIFPFFLVNLLMGLTAIKTGTYFYVSQAGMLAGTVIYVNAGKELAKLESVSGIFTPSLITSLALLGLFPFIAKKLVVFVHRD